MIIFSSTFSTTTPLTRVSILVLAVQAGAMGDEHGHHLLVAEGGGDRNGSASFLRGIRSDPMLTSNMKTFQ